MVDKECLKCGFYDPDTGCNCPAYEPWLCVLDEEAQREFDEQFMDLTAP